MRLSVNIFFFYKNIYDFDIHFDWNSVFMMCDNYRAESINKYLKKYILVTDEKINGRIHLYEYINKEIQTLLIQLITNM